MRYTKENIVEGINAKLDAMIAKDEILRTMCEAFRPILPNYPIEVEQNVLEWVNGDPLTDIDCHGFSIAQTMEDGNLHETYFMLLIKNLIKYKEGDFKHEVVCYDML